MGQAIMMPGANKKSNKELKLSEKEGSDDEPLKKLLR